MKHHFLWMLFISLLSISVKAGNPDPKFLIYLCIGQSNMEAGAQPAEQDKNFDNPRFRFISAVDMPRYQREMGKWYTAIPPICRQENNMGPVDFFGRKMIENLPEEYKVGVINVSVAGAKIELWDKDNYKEYIDNERDWMKNIVNQYDGNPYKRLVEMARIAQQDGVIKGLLIHQGESNADDPEWPAKVKKIYNDLCKDLGLKAKEFPLLAGELKRAEQGGACASFNERILPNLPKVLPNAHIISSLACQSTGDAFHFSTEGMRLLGYRYAEKMLQLQGFALPQKRELTLDMKNLGIDISPTLSGIFFEDINQSLDGGICAQLIQNFSFQQYMVPDAPEKEFSRADSIIFGWSAVKAEGAKGRILTVEDTPLLGKQTRHYDYDPIDKYDDELRYKQYCVKFEIEQVGKGMGLAANGYGISPYGQERQGHYYSNNTQTPSIPVKRGVSYDLSLYLRADSYKGNVNVYLEDAQGNLNSNIVKISNLTNGWKKYTGVLKAENARDSRMVVMADASGEFYLDFATLMPEASELWMEGKAGPFRKDLMQALADLNPTFMRFPGGCASEGTNYFGQVFWKNSVGPREERIGFRNHWGYWTSQYVGFYEYFLMAESLGATPLPVLNNGVTCQFAGHQYVAPLDTEADRKRFYNIFVKDALDLIEFCNGDTNTTWGAVRAEMGHPEPFNLKYLGIGNENRGEKFWERFDIIYNEVKKLHPEIIIVSTSGAADAGREFNANYAEIDEKYPDTYVDEHYYKRDDWFYKNQDRYAPGKERGNQGKTYDRSRPTRVFVGEFANNSTNNAYSSTLAEAAYWTSLERNSDMVVMAAYAPLFCKKGFNKWNSNLIWFDNRGMWRTTNYYYQHLFSKGGNRAFEISPVMNGDSIDTHIYTSPTIDTESGTAYIKFVNAEAMSKQLTIRIGNKTRYTATMQCISSLDTRVKNQGDQNFYAGHPDVRRANYNEAVVPNTITLGEVKKTFTLTIPENSVGVIKLVEVVEK